MKTPDGEHPIEVRLNPKRVRVRVAGHVIADSDQALMLKEADYPEVAYLPRKDVEMGFLAKTFHETHCPYKGQAAYYTVHIEGRLLENAAWSYEDPFPAAMAVKDRLAFYPDKVEIYEVDPDEV